MKRHTATHPILIVETNNDPREAILTLLSMNDYRANGVHNRETALTMLRAGLRPCLILLDLIVPGDGWKFRMEQMADPELAQLPVIGGAMIKATQDHIDPALRVDDILMNPSIWTLVCAARPALCRRSAGVTCPGTRDVARWRARLVAMVMGWPGG